MSLESRVEPEDLARSLIREFFLKYKYSKSLEAFEAEDIRERVKMTKIDLIRLLSMERLVKNNKSKPQPQQSLIEVLTDYLFARFRSRPATDDLHSEQHSSHQFDPNNASASSNRPNRSSSQASDHSQLSSMHQISDQWKQQQPTNVTQFSHQPDNKSTQLPVSRLPTQQQQLPLHTSSDKKALHSTQQSYTNNNTPSNHNNTQADQIIMNHPHSKPEIHSASSVANSAANSFTMKPPPSLVKSEQGSQSQSSNDSEEFRIESRRGNMRKGSRNVPTSKATPSIDESLASASASRVSNNHHHQENSELFKNMEDQGAANFTSHITIGSKILPGQSSSLSSAGATGSATASINTTASIITTTANSTAAQDDQFLNEFATQSKIISSKHSDSSNNHNNNSLPQQSAPPQQPEQKAQQAPPTAPATGEKQFNFFGKKKSQEEPKSNPTQQQQQQSSLSKRNSVLDPMDDFNSLLEDNSNYNQKQQQNQFEQPSSNTRSKPLASSSRRVKKGPFDEDDDDLDFTKPASKPSKQNPSSTINAHQSHSGGPVEGHVEFNFTTPGNIQESAWEGFEQNTGIVYTKSATSGGMNSNMPGVGSTFSKKTLNNIPLNEVADIRKLLFNQAQNKFLPASWAQGFQLSPHASTFYGIVQKEGGPCGVLACVQAFFLKHLYFQYPKSIQNNSQSSQIDFENQTVRENCLIAALAEILFRAKPSTSDTIRLAIPNNKVSIQNAQQATSIDSCSVAQFKATTLQQAFENFAQYKSDFFGMTNSGVTTFLYSVILTRGTRLIAEEMDSKENALIGHHGHCSQEQVNLFLTGRARTNCFDGEKVLDGEFKLSGIDARAQFGFLTIFEHLKYIEVGSHLKTPIFPVWIICKEYHYSVVFAKDFRPNEVKDTKYFDLVYYDQLYNPEDRILLTLTNFKYTTKPFPKKNDGNNSGSGQTHFMFKRKQRGESAADDKEDEDMIPVIELVLRTKWGKDIEVDWNGTQPIL